MDPVRTCIGCRSRQERTGLVRVVAVSGQIRFDRDGRLPGRGAWLHPSAACIGRAIERRAFGRAFRHGRVDVAEAREYARQLADAQAPARTEKAERTMDNS
ncbi:YlxR family protein [Pseudoclavibacter chungangensis]|uniref:YlxR family protein n=1 Tax=Pseudoclavibacter chungangensis TaxID=587635 RepID=A0A7J5BSK6_9MICO|nr:YlxR family protein [Pseudoclavibacter chungangensis]KAB1657300.1 YlxR family protein [Pseudoclavibacter chungangensis]NYJ66251.1 putative RNA-binding protein YlxR (DUF448 family) [Pseudoclavibacter chungangensis]